MENAEYINTDKQPERELDALKSVWQKYFKTSVTRKSSREFLSRNISWQRQASQRAGHKP
jgi:hypothetical protein